VSIILIVSVNHFTAGFLDDIMFSYIALRLFLVRFRFVMLGKTRSLLRFG